MQFDFGQNWSEFSEKALTSDKILEAKSDFACLMEGATLKDKSFLDIGFGQGLSLLTAASMGAKTVGCEINPKCVDILNRNLTFFPEISDSDILTIIGSILDNSTIENLRKKSPAGDGSYDIVHSWGVLHHTGNMKLAIKNAAELVRHGGILVLALYNRHWSSTIWLVIQRFYCNCPKWIQRAMIIFFYPVIWIAKLLATGKNPRKQSRGMDFFYDVIDWVGGYPYEYATIQEINEILNQYEFEIIRVINAEVPTGCNQFVFRLKLRGQSDGNRY